MSNINIISIASPVEMCRQAGGPFANRRPRYLTPGTVPCRSSGCIRGEPAVLRDGYSSSSCMRRDDLEVLPDLEGDSTSASSTSRG
jgi:hypothetical protein